jgi:protein-disulfide isomerase
LAAKAALAAHRHGKFNEFHRALMSANDFSESGLQNIASQVGLAEGFLTNIDAPEVNEALQRNYDLSNRLNISGTPALVIGDRIVPGAASVETLAMFVTAERLRLVAKAIQGEKQ